MVTSGEPRDEDELYHRLGLGADASRDEIARAYRRLAHGAHPDAHPGDPDASRRFRELTEAYEVLADPARRARYDGAQHPARAHDARRGPAPASPGSVTAAPRPVHRGPVSLASPALWAGPVHVEPDRTAPSPGVGTTPEQLADAVAGLVWRLLAEGWLP